ncbi:MAG: Truncated hemoglobin [Actinomycetota bacterium]|jgi:hemoglobin
MPSDGSEREVTLYEAVGGMLFFERLVDGFYARVGTDPVLSPLYPDTDYGPAKRRLTLFLAQYWGGPTIYSDERGHPRLKMRHHPYVIGAAEQQHWMDAMTASIDDLEPMAEVRTMLLEYFEKAAEHLRNDGPLRFTGSA